MDQRDERNEVEAANISQTYLVKRCLKNQCPRAKTYYHSQKLKQFGNTGSANLCPEN